ncbi:MAG: molybdopterin molybdenumtransferase MoeA [Pelagibacteraceae bacterium]|nr:molybdopterin molybdenumtransferase MoeA [Pelagibacteraceae bacterium]|tara:strand:- start:7528 stop:8748 length:1221 start_codon:yes stop_codon:yes gene_type:complete
MNKKPLKKKEVINILNNIKVLKRRVEKIDIKDSINRIIAEDITSPINVPPFNNSAVDGYAIQNVDINKFNNYRVVARIAAGQNKVVKLRTGEAVRIFTGSKMPDNANTVVMQEAAIEKDNFVSFISQPSKNSNWRRAGEDIRKGKLIFKKGTMIKTSTQSMIASMGIRKIKVFNKLKIGFFTSGNELVNPSKKLIGSKINNSNQYTLFSLISKFGFQPTYLGRLTDNPKNINNSIIKKINKFDVIITTGGASVGDEDHLVKIIKKIGNLIFWKIAIKPGRPFAFGIVKRKPIICLPGNPVSVFLLFLMIIKPFLNKLSGSTFKEPRSFPAKINFNMNKKSMRMEWLRVKIEKKYINQIVLNRYLKQGSGVVSSIEFSDGIIEIPENVSRLKIGDVFNFYPNESLFD